MSKSDYSSCVRLTSPPLSRPASKAYSVDQDTLVHAKPRSMSVLNVLFLGETNFGESSIIDLIAGPREQKRVSRHAGLPPLDNDARNVTLSGKVFKLHASPMSESASSVALTEGIQNMSAVLRNTGGIHLLVYCMNTLHSTLWVHEVHRTIASSSMLSALSPRIPVVAVIIGTSDIVQQESWWSSNEDVFADQGLHFDNHAYIRTAVTVTQSSTGDYNSESRHTLHSLILQNCATALGSEADLDLQRMASQKQGLIGNSFQSLFVTLAGKLSSHTSADPKIINIILLGEIGVGKSSIINLIARENIAKVSSDTIGCTKAAAKYTFEQKGKTFHLYDTPGLVDPQMGVASFVDPIDTIQKLIHSLDDGNAPGLFLLCIDNSKPTVAVRRNYRLFHKIICERKVPLALAITKLAEGQSGDQWWNKYGAMVRSYGIDCLGHVGIGHEKRHSDPRLDSEGQLRELLLSFFVACIDRRNHRINSLRSSVGRMVGSVATLLRPPAPTLEKTLMNQCGLDEQTARELANRVVSIK